MRSLPSSFLDFSSLVSTSHGVNPLLAHSFNSINIWTSFALILVAISASLASSGGLGGGSLYVSIFYLLLRVDIKTATAISSFLVAGSMLANVIWSMGQHNPERNGKPLINYDMGIRLLPCMLLGISFGTFCHAFLPSWVITLLLIMLLVYLSLRSCNTGVRLWKFESLVINRDQNTPCFQVECPSDIKSEGKDDSSLPQENKDDLLQPLLPASTFSGPSKELLLMSFVWFAFTIIQLLKSRKEFVNFGFNEVGNWLLSACQIPLALGVTAWTILGNKGSIDTINITGAKQQMYTFLPAGAFIAGAAGSMLGIGGGMILNPILLRLGLHPQETTSTTAILAFFSSSQSALQYWLRGSVPVAEALRFSGVCFISAFITAECVKRMIKRLSHPSLVVLMVSLEMGVSAILISILGILEEF